MSNRFGFEQVYPGKWKHAETGNTIILDEDYKKTYRVYNVDRTGHTERLRNPDGRVIRFRTIEGAAKAALNNKGVWS